MKSLEPTLARDGVILDVESLNGRELQPDEIAAARLQLYERKRDALQQLRNDRSAREQSRAVNH